MTKNNEIIKKYLSKHNLESYIDEEIISKMKINFYDKGEFVFLSGINKKELMFFVEGLCKITMFSEEGNEMLLKITKPFDLMGDIEFILKDDVYYNVEAKEPSIYFTISYEEAVKHPKLYELISLTLARKLNNISLRYSYSMLYNTKNIVADFIYQNNKYIGDSINFTEISKLTRISDRQFRRVIKQFESEGILKRTGTKLEILDEEKLKTYLFNKK